MHLRAVSAMLLATLATVLPILDRPVTAQCPVARVRAPFFVVTEYYGASLVGPLALSGDRLLMWPGDAVGTVAVLRHEGSRWGSEAVLDVPGDPLGHFAALALDGDVAVVGVDEVVHVYRRTGAGWAYEAALSAADGAPDDRFGASVAVHLDLIVVGAPGADSLDRDEGAVYVFRFDGATWSQEQKLVPELPLEAALGHDVATDGTSIVAGAPDWVDLSTFLQPGAVFGWRQDGSRWVERPALVPPANDERARLGRQVAVAGDWVIAGAPQDGARGAGHAFRWNGFMWQWAQRLEPPDANADDAFFIGETVAVGPDTAALGAPYPNREIAYLFRLTGGTWAFETKLAPPDASSQDDFGGDLAIDGSRLVIGAYSEEPFGSAEAYYRDVFVYDTTDLAGADCDRDGICDAEQMATEPALDCDGNSVLDACDLAAGTVEDCNANGIVDVCEHRDCNRNGIVDDCDVVSGVSDDCNGNGTPDECELSYVLDDGSGEFGAGVQYGGTSVWLNQFMVRPGEEVVDAIGIAWWEVRDAVTRLHLYADPNQDGDPSDAVRLVSVEVDTLDHAAGTIHQFAIPPTDVGVAGESFFVGATMPGVPPGGAHWRPMAVDRTGPGLLRSWLAFVHSGDVPDDLSTLFVSPFAPLYGGGDFLLRAGTTAPVACVPPADLDGDGHVGLTDLVLLLASWGGCTGDCPADLDYDGSVGLGDLPLLFAAWSAG